jgi:putative membrane protein
MLRQVPDPASAVAEVWAFSPHPEVWFLIASLILGYVYMVRVIGPEAVPEGPVVSRRNVVCFALAVAMLWVASDWPMHDISENYLYSAHMLQHMMMSYFLAPLALLAIPEWMARTLVGRGRVYGTVRFLAKPVVAGVIFNAYVMVTHIPGVVNNSVDSAVLHYSLHTILVITSVIMFMPVCGPLPELHLQPAPKMVYLFLQSVVPTIPAAWLTFAEGVVYDRYDTPVRVWGISVELDQQIAGAIMKLGGSVFLWSIILTIFIRHFVRGQDSEMRLRRSDEAAPEGYARSAADFAASSASDTLTFEDVQTAFAATAAPSEPQASTPP